MNCLRPSQTQPGQRTDSRSQYGELCTKNYAAGTTADCLHRAALSWLLHSTPTGARTASSIRHPNVHAERPQTRTLLQVRRIWAMVKGLPTHATRRACHHHITRRPVGSCLSRVGYGRPAAGALWTLRLWHWATQACPAITAPAPVQLLSSASVAPAATNAGTDIAVAAARFLLAQAGMP